MKNAKHAEARCILLLGLINGHFTVKKRYNDYQL